MSKSTMQSAGDWKPVVAVDISEEDGAWNAECRELDYIACGATIDEAKKNFTEGLHMTILLHRRLGKHRCIVCRNFQYVMPNFDWRFVEGQPA